MSRNKDFDEKNTDMIEDPDDEIDEEDRVGDTYSMFQRRSSGNSDDGEDRGIGIGWKIASYAAVAAVTAVIMFFVMGMQENKKMSGMEEQLKASEAKIAGLEAQLEEANTNIQEKVNIIIKDDNVINTQKSELSSANGKVTELEGKLSEAQTASAQKDSTIASLEEDVKNAESKTDEVEKEKDKLQEENDKMKEENDFFDKHAVIVNRTGTKLYHKYSCKDWNKNNYMIYNLNLAEQNGYKPCPKCWKE